MKKRVTCKLLGQNGNIFNLLAIASNALKQNGQHEDAKKMINEVFQSKSYAEALGIISNYVDIV